MRRFDLYSRALPQALRVALALWFALLCASVPAEALVPPQAATMGGAAHLAGSLIDLNFAKGKFYLKGAAGPLTNSRSTPSWCLTIAGALVAAAAFQNCDTDLGVSSFEARTNGVRNNVMAGAGAGTLPNFGWVVGQNGQTGVTTTVLGTTVLNGMTFLNLSVAGVPSASGNVQIFFDGFTAEPALYGQTVSLALSYY